jgi:hypothetical protein
MKMNSEESNSLMSRIRQLEEEKTSYNNTMVSKIGAKSDATTNIFDRFKLDISEKNKFLDLQVSKGSQHQLDNLEHKK